MPAIELFVVGRRGDRLTKTPRNIRRMALKIVKHYWKDHEVRQRTDGFVNLTDMCRINGKRVGDFLDLPTVKDYIAALADDLGLLPEDLVIRKRGRYGDTFAHPEIAIECARWVSMAFHIWANRTLRNLIETGSRSSRTLEIPEPGTPIFEAWFEKEIERITGLHKNDIRNGRFYWEFVYRFLTPDERSHIERINPPCINGRRKYKIHDCLTAGTKARLIPLQYKLAGKIESCNTVHELRRMFDRMDGIEQPNLFDGIWQSVGLLQSGAGGVDR